MIIWQDFKTVRAKSALSTYIYEYLHRAGFALTVLKSCHIKLNNININIYHVSKLINSKSK